MNQSKIVILGNGIAGFTAAEQIRTYSTEIDILMISEEQEESYLRPMLSKLYFRTLTRSKLQVVEDKWYEEQKITRMLGKVVHKIHAENKMIELKSGEYIHFDTCIYALGAGSFMPPFKGADFKGVMTVRNILDLNSLRKLLTTAKEVVMIGGGVIGLEIAWEITKMGCHVVLLEASERIMSRSLDVQSCEILTQQIREHGIQVDTEITIQELQEHPEKPGWVNGVKLTDGRVFPADLVVVSAGIRANIGVAQQSGICCDRGVLVDDKLMTNYDYIFAAGDCIQLDTPNPGLWNYAKLSGAIAGYNAVNTMNQRSFLPMTDPLILNVMDTSIFSIGDIREDSEVEIHVDYGDHREEVAQFFVNTPKKVKLIYSKKFYRNGELCGAVLLGDLSQMKEIQNEINQK